MIKIPTVMKWQNWLIDNGQEDDTTPEEKKEISDYLSKYIDSEKESLSDYIAHQIPKREQITSEFQALTTALYDSLASLYIWKEGELSELIKDINQRFLENKKSIE